MARDSRLVYEIGMDLIGLPVGVMGDELEDDAEVEEEPTELDAMAALADRLERLADRLAVTDKLDAVIAQQAELAMLLTRLTDLVMLPRRKVPVRDEAGRITATWETVEMPDAAL
jgi:hypothetical protein